METCKTCRWWHETDYGTGSCQPEPNFWAEEYNEDVIPDGARSCCDHVNPETGPNFGCIHHEPSEPND